MPAQNQKISIKRLIQLQREFKHNYENVSPKFFNSLDNKSKLDLLNDEFHFDKAIIDLEPRFTLFNKKLSTFDKNYLYTTSFLQLSSNINDQIHVLHNVYRTIAAFNLTNCTLEEKATILSKSVKKITRSQIDLFKISCNRLNNLANYTNQHTI